MVAIGPNEALTAEAMDADTRAADLRSRAVRGGSIFFSSRFVIQIFQWLSTLVVARLLAPDDYGVMTTATIIIGVADLCADAGLSRALIQNRNFSKTAIGEVFTFSACLSVLLYGIIWILGGVVAGHLQKPEFADFLRAVGLVLLIMPWQSVSSALLERELRFERLAVIQTTAALLQAAAVVVFAYEGYGFWALGIGVLIARFAQTLLLWHATAWRPRISYPTSEGIALLRYGATVNSAALLWFCYSNADFAIVSAELGTKALGFYSLAFQLISIPVQRLTATVNQIAFPAYCRLQHEPQRLRDWVLKLMVILSFVSIPALCGLALVADSAIPLLLGEKWRDVVLPFQLLAPVGTIMVVSSTVPPLLNAFGRPDIILKYNTACFLLLPLAFYFGAVNAGVVGVCIGWLLLQPVLSGTLVQMTRHITLISLADIFRAHLPVLVATACMAAAVGLVGSAWPADTSVAGLICKILAGAIAYLTSIVIYGRHSVLADIKALSKDFRGRPAH